MSDPFAHSLPPLRDLPPPPRLPEEDVALIPPGEIIAESKQALLGRLWRMLWAPALVLLGLWYLLLVLYIAGASPALWFFALLGSLGDPSLLRASRIQLGFGSGLGTAFLLVPAAATLLSLALTPLIPSALAGMRPRRHLSEAGFQKAVTDRVVAVLMAPPVLIVLAVPLSAAAGMPQPWAGLGAGPLSTWCLAILALLCVWPLLRGRLPASRLLGITAHDDLRRTATVATDPEQRRAAARQVLAQDRRHLPPNPGTPAARGGATPRGALTALAWIARAGLRWVLPATAGVGWLVFAVADLVIMLQGISSVDLSQVDSPLSLGQMLLVIPVAALVLLGLAITPALALPLAENQRAQVRDQRTYEEWAHRARVNPWEARVATLTGWLGAGWTLAATVLLAVLLEITRLATGFTWVWIAVAALMIAPLTGGAAAHGMRRGLRDVLYGPAGDFMRRESPYALLAPELGTRADRARDPAVRAALRKRLQAEGGDHGLAIFDLDAAGERLWVDDSEPGATDAAVRAADLAGGRLPDFGSEGSAFTGGGRHGRAADGGRGPHEIPDSLGKLRDR